MPGGPAEIRDIGGKLSDNRNTVKPLRIPEKINVARLIFQAIIRPACHTAGIYPGKLGEDLGPIA
jgi:hypothetical protein